MTGECGSCGEDKALKARGLCLACYHRCTLDGTLGQYGWVRADRLAEFGQLRDRHYPVEFAGARVGVSSRTAWRYEAAPLIASVSAVQATRDRVVLAGEVEGRAA